MNSLAQNWRPGRAAPAGFEVEARRGGVFGLAGGGDRRGAAPDGAYNFVRVQGWAPNRSRLLISAGLAHADLAAGAPVIYAGTVRFERGRVAWWSNYSGTYQPIAAFRERAKLPEDRFVPWQNLQLGGHAQQRTLQRDLRPLSAPEPGRPVATPERTEGAMAASGPVRASNAGPEAAGRTAQTKRRFAAPTCANPAPPAFIWPARRAPR